MIAERHRRTFKQIVVDLFFAHNESGLYPKSQATAGWEKEQVVVRGALLTINPFGELQSGCQLANRKKPPRQRNTLESGSRHPRIKPYPNSGYALLQCPVKGMDRLSVPQEK